MSTHVDLEALESPRLDSLVGRLVSRLADAADVRTVFGDPVERGEVTVIPVARVLVGAGAGTGRSERGDGEGGGGGAIARPLGYVEIRNGATRFRPINPRVQATLATAALLTAGALIVWALRRPGGAT